MQPPAHMIISSAPPQAGDLGESCTVESICVCPGPRQVQALLALRHVNLAELGASTEHPWPAAAASLNASGCAPASGWMARSPSCARRRQAPRPRWTSVCGNGAPSATWSAAQGRRSACACGARAPAPRSPPQLRRRAWRESQSPALPRLPRACDSPPQRCAGPCAPRRWPGHPSTSRARCERDRRSVAGPSRGPQLRGCLRNRRTCCASRGRASGGQRGWPARSASRCARGVGAAKRPLLRRWSPSAGLSGSVARVCFGSALGTGSRWAPCWTCPSPCRGESPSWASSPWSGASWTGAPNRCFAPTKSSVPERRWLPRAVIPAICVCAQRHFSQDA